MCKLIQFLFGSTTLESAAEPPPPDEPIAELFDRLGIHELKTTDLATLTKQRSAIDSRIEECFAPYRVAGKEMAAIGNDLRDFEVEVEEWDDPATLDAEFGQALDSAIERLKAIRKRFAD